MEPTSPSGPTIEGPRLGWGFVILGLFAVIFGGGAFAVQALLKRSAEPEPSVEVVRPTPEVIVSMRQLALLQTSSFHMERVIDLRDKQSHVFGLVHVEDAILLVAAGDVTAGVDLSTLRDEDVVVDAVKHSVRIVLPPAQILSATLDNQATYVHTRRTDALAKRQETLETRARQEAERTLRDAAIAGGILERARDGAERAVRGLARSLGFESVELSFRRE
jgi:hypothetical protein